MQKFKFVWGAFLFSSCVLLFFAGCSQDKIPSLLKNKSPIQSQGVSSAQKITDGVAGEEGDLWNSEPTSFLSSSDAFVIYDLGHSQPIEAFFLQGDNNDTYQVYVSDSLSEGQANWDLVWSAGFRGGAGLRNRFVRDLHVQGRYLKLQAIGGDGAFSVSEFQAYASVPAEWKPDIRVTHSMQGSFGGRVRMIVFGVSLILYSLFSAYPNRAWVYRLALIPALTGYELFRWIIAQQSKGIPIDDLDLAYLKLVISIVGIFVLIQSRYFASFLRPRMTVVKGVLFALAIFSVGIYYHFGHLQFPNMEARRQTAVHTWDMRVYYPIAKFFKELQFDGLYLACLQAYIDEHPQTTDSELAGVSLRNLNNNEVVSGLSVKEDAKVIKARFSPERWEEFRHDMRWFEGAMGRNSYLGSMTDHGGNATPVWMWMGHLLFRDAHDVEGRLTVTAWIDPLCLVLLFAVVGYTFGWIPMCLCMIIFGSTEFYRFGSNLAGSTMRQDWLVAFGLGVCALRKKRYMLGGAGLAYSSLIRAFPALGVFGLGLWWVVDVGIKIYRKEPVSFKSLWKDYIPFWKTTIGVVGCVVFFFAITSATFGYEHSWKPWFSKITMHADKPNVNHLGFRNLFSFDSEKTAQKLSERGNGWESWIQTQRDTFAQRKYFVDLAMIASLIFLARAMRRKSLGQVGLLGLLFIPVVFYPANYYFHYVFLLPLLGVFSKDTIDQQTTPFFVQINVVLLTMCAVHYFPLLENQMDVSFTEQSWILVLGFGLLMLASVLTQEKE